MMGKIMEVAEMIGQKFIFVISDWFGKTQV